MDKKKPHSTKIKTVLYRFRHCGAQPQQRTVALLNPEILKAICRPTKIHVNFASESQPRIDLLILGEARDTPAHRALEGICPGSLQPMRIVLCRRRLPQKWAILYKGREQSLDDVVPLWGKHCRAAVVRCAAVLFTMQKSIGVC